MLGLVLLQNVVLDRPSEHAHVDALLFGGGDVEAVEDDRRPVDRHRDGDLIERDPLEETLHVGERGDRHTADADLAE